MDLKSIKIFYKNNGVKNYYVTDLYVHCCLRCLGLYFIVLISLFSHIGFIAVGITPYNKQKTICYKNFMNNIYEESKVFISYQTTDKNIAGEIKRILEAYNINSFLAYEDLEVSVEWENEILKRINESTLFICLLSKNYSNSIYCLQESGIAIIKNMTIIPLSIDDAISPGFLSKYQSKKIDPKKILVDDIIPGLIKWNKDLAIKIIIDIIGASGSFRGAEENFRTYFHYLNDLSDKQAIDLFEKILDNSQIYCAHLCIKEYIPKLIQKYKYVLTQGEYRKFKKSCGVYGISI